MMSLIPVSSYILNTYMFVATTSHDISTILALSRLTGVVELAAVFIRRGPFQ